jgi:hypothetical protein
MRISGVATSSVLRASAAAKLETKNGIKAVYRFNCSRRTNTPDAVGILSSVGENRWGN